jgi:ribosomal protein L33
MYKLQIWQTFLIKKKSPLSPKKKKVKKNLLQSCWLSLHIWLGDLRGLIHLQLNQMHLGCWVDNVGILSLTYSPDTQPVASPQSVNARIGMEIVTLQCLQCTLLNWQWYSEMKICDFAMFAMHLVELTRYSEIMKICDFAMFAMHLVELTRYSEIMKIVTLQCLQCTLWNWQGTLKWKIVTLQCLQCTLSNWQGTLLLDVWRERIGVMIHFNECKYLKVFLGEF